MEGPDGTIRMQYEEKLVKKCMKSALDSEDTRKKVKRYGDEHDY